MKPAAKPYAFLAVVMFGLYGCAKSPLSPSHDDRSVREKLQKLESEHQSVVAARDQIRQKLLDSEKQQLRLKEELATLQASLTQQLQSRTAEPDAVQVQYDSFRKTIKDLIGQAEASLPIAPAPQSTTALTSRTR